VGGRPAYAAATCLPSPFPRFCAPGARQHDEQGPGGAGAEVGACREERCLGVAAATLQAPAAQEVAPGRGLLASPGSCTAFVQCFTDRKLRQQQNMTRPGVAGTLPALLVDRPSHPTNDSWRSLPALQIAARSGPCSPQRLRRLVPRGPGTADAPGWQGAGPWKSPE